MSSFLVGAIERLVGLGTEQYVRSERHVFLRTVFKTCELARSM